MDTEIKELELNLDGNEKENMIMVETAKHYDDTNEAVVEGPVVGSYDTSGATLLTILTNTGRDSKDTSGITVRMNKELMDRLGEVKTGSHLHIEGRVYSRRRGDAYEPGVLADKAELMKSDMDERFGLAGRIYSIPYNRITLVGNIARMTQESRNTAVVLLSVNPEGDRQRFIEVTVFANNLKRLLPDLAIGNRIVCVAEYRVNKKTYNEGTKNERTMYFRNVVALDIKTV